MKSFRHLAFFVTMLILPSASKAQSLFRVIGTVALRDQDKQRPLKDASQVAVWLVPTDAADDTVRSSAYHPASYQMRQQDKRFEPHLLVVPVGSSVRFPNLDPWFHNVFSLYRGKRFDLGLYQAGSQKSVQFDRPGPSYIFCNIHPEMSAVILAVNSHYIGVSVSSGNIAIADVPPGHYRVHFWYEFAADLGAIETRDITVGQDKANTFGTTTIAVRPSKSTHTNKYGQQYDPQSLSPEY